MPTLTIHDTIHVPRQVEIPDECPECGASFRTGANLIEWDTVSVQFIGNLAEDPTTKEHDFEVHNEDDRGDDFRVTSYYCSECRTCLHDGSVREVAGDALNRSVAEILANQPPNFAQEAH